MAATQTKGEGTLEGPWVLQTPPGKSEYLAYRDGAADPPALVVIVGKTELRYRLSCLDDLCVARRCCTRPPRRPVVDELWAVSLALVRPHAGGACLLASGPGIGGPGYRVTRSARSGTHSPV
jgi:hypothetical protein